MLSRMNAQFGKHVWLQAYDIDGSGELGLEEFVAFMAALRNEYGELHDEFEV